MKEFIPSKLPLKKDIETKEILRATITAHKTLAELKGIANSLPNQKIVINTLVLQEAKDSSEIENIITTYDEIYRSDISDSFINSDIKEVQNYKDALYLGFEIIKTKKFLTINHIKEIQSTLEKNDAGFRKQSGTVLKNPTNDVSFNDGLNNWILFILKGIEEISKETIKTIKNIENLMNETKNIIIEQKPKIYSKDLLEALFYHPYTKRVFIEEQLNISRPTATNYLNELEKLGILSSKKIGKEVFYVHNKLFELFKDM